MSGNVFTVTLFDFLQLYEINDDPKRKEFLDDLFSYMQKRGESFIFLIFNTKTADSRCTRLVQN